MPNDEENPVLSSALVFSVDARQYALDISLVRTVTPLLDARALPGAPEYVYGLISYRGGIVPVLDVTRILAGVPAKPFYSTRIAIVEYPLPVGGYRLLGLLLEKTVRAVKEIAEPWRPTGLAIASTPYLGGVAHLDGSTVQQITLEELLPEDVRALLFPEEPA